MGTSPEQSPRQSVGVVGAGILGLAVARRLQQVFPGIGVTVLEKEDAVARHQTGNNSGVVHAGVYYPPGSLKARLCRRGMALTREYAQEKGVVHQSCGKLVVAADETEVARLDDLERRARSNGVPGLRRLGRAEITDVEPHAVGVAALHSPETAITAFVAISEALAADVRAAGGEVLLDAEVDRVRPEHHGVRVATADGRDFAFDHLVLCAGLQSDRLAVAAGDVADPVILPFRGEYLQLVPARADLVRGLIYPVPDPAYPFLGVHFTRRVDGTVDVGPNAVLATARQGYRRRDVSLPDLAAVATHPGFWRIARRHWRTGAAEVAGSLSPRLFVRRARVYVPELRREDVVPGGAGVRAQAVDRDGTLVDDFRIHHLGRVTALRNAPSPAATSALAIAEHVVDELTLR